MSYFVAFDLIQNTCAGVLSLTVDGSCAGLTYVCLSSYASAAGHNGFERDHEVGRRRGGARSYYELEGVFYSRRKRAFCEWPPGNDDHLPGKVSGNQYLPP